MKKWVWLVLVLLTAIGIISSSRLFWHPPQVANLNPVPTTKVNYGLAASRQPSKSPNVDPNKLFAHVQALNYRRYTEAERDRARSYLTKSLKEFGWLPTLESFEGGTNVFAQQQGTDPAAGAILLAAHYDTVANSPGADDNASGVAVVLEVARLFSSHPLPRTLQLAFFDQEELGLRGSMAFAVNKAHLKTCTV
jgi:acetylornithine deacetylase/succinyl-diaminopimelate desuccinylase-like protein